LYVFPAHPVAARLPFPPALASDPPAGGVPEAPLPLSGGEPLEEPLPLPNNEPLEEPLPLPELFPLGAGDPGLDGSAEPPLEDPLFEGGGEELEPAGAPVFAGSICGVVEDELGAFLEAPDEHPALPIVSHKPARASSVSRAAGERRRRREKARLELMRMGTPQVSEVSESTLGAVAFARGFGSDLEAFYF